MDPLLSMWGEMSHRGSSFAFICGQQSRCHTGTDTVHCASITGNHINHDATMSTDHLQCFASVPNFMMLLF